MLIEAAVTIVLAFPYRLLSFDTVLTRTKVCAVGTVVYRRKQDDGDWHVTLMDVRQRLLVLEIIPELPLPVPAKGQRLLACGISRKDPVHGWPELHPLVRWELQPKG